MSLRFFGDWPPWLGVTVALTAAALVWWFYRRDTRDSPPMARWSLPTLRAMAVALAILTLTGPVLRRTETIGELGRVVFCVDASESMSRSDPNVDQAQVLQIAAAQGWLPADVVEQLNRDAASVSDAVVVSRGRVIDEALQRYEQSTRFDRARGLLTGKQGLLAELQSTHQLSVSGLSGVNADPWWDSAETDEVPTEFAVTAGAAQTDLATPVMQRLGLDESQVVEASGETDETAGPRTAVVLFSDGRHTNGPSPIEMATQLASRRIPLYCVGFGSDVEPTDLAVLELQYPDSVASKNRVRGTLVWKDRGPVGRAVRATIWADEELLWEQQLTTQNVPLRRTEFDFAIRDIVEARLQEQVRDVRLQSLPLVLTAKLEPLGDETDASNNVSEFRISAVVNDHRLLLIDGRSRWETRYLRNLFQRDEAWQVNALIVGRSSQHRVLPRGEGDNDFPTNEARLTDYDLIVLGEVDADTFTAEEQTWIREYVARGGGLVVIDGTRGKWKGLAETPLGDLLPVTLGEQPAMRTDSLQLTSSGLDWSPLRLRSERESNRELWQQLPAPQSLAAVVPLPGADVVVEAFAAGQPHPAVVRRPFGAGQVTYFAFDDSWRWRYEVADQFHVRFWNQIGKTVMQAPYAASDAFASLDTGLAQYRAGDAANVRVRLRDPSGRPVSDATVDALLSRDGQVVSTIRLTALDTQTGMYRGRTDPLAPGVYTTTVRASGYSEAALQVTTEFRVTASISAETETVSCNETLLREIAEASGGQYLPEASADQLAELLKPLSSGRTEENDTLIWRSYWWFWAILGLLSVEWLLRKRSGLL